MHVIKQVKAQNRASINEEEEEANEDGITAVGFVWWLKPSWWMRKDEQVNETDVFASWH